VTTLTYIIENTLNICANENLFLIQYVKDGLTYTYAADYTLFFTLKLTVCLLILILIRGGVPRYRYDFLTKIGWVKFLGYVLALFLTTVLLFVLW